ncbi:MAG: hypothetical protein BGO12_10010 [Verrucomicrobia bacterium 61-8]|nr:MAG: hypothetical protein BGO12_10010 [Verrucomicrobia bacterium 61-8]
MRKLFWSKQGILSSLARLSLQDNIVAGAALPCRSCHALTLQRPVEIPAQGPGYPRRPETELVERILLPVAIIAGDFGEIKCGNEGCFFAIGTEFFDL